MHIQSCGVTQENRSNRKQPSKTCERKSLAHIAHSAKALGLQKHSSHHFAPLSPQRQCLHARLQTTTACLRRFFTPKVQRSMYHLSRLSAPLAGVHGVCQLQPKQLFPNNTFRHAQSHSWLVSTLPSLKNMFPALWSAPRLALFPRTRSTLKLCKGSGSTRRKKKHARNHSIGGPATEVPQHMQQVPGSHAPTPLLEPLRGLSHRLFQFCFRSYIRPSSSVDCVVFFVVSTTKR